MNLNFTNSTFFKSLFLILVINLLFAFNASGQFITTWQTTTASESITIPTYGGATYNYDVNWGDGNTSTGKTGSATHTYAVAGTYTVSITGTFPRIYFTGNAVSRLKIKTIVQWGTNPWTSMNRAFMGASNLTSVAIDNPNLSAVTNMSFMFSGATSFNGNISGWTFPNVTDMNSMFRDATSFNSDISGWTFSNVTDMNDMFQNATSFNADISGWTFPNVTDMNGMFRGTTSFNADISGWTFPNVTDMNSMFRDATSFNANISGWNVSNVTTMNAMFASATSFNKDLGGWSLNAASSMQNMLNNCGMDVNNYDNTLIGWESQGITGRTLGAIGLEYCTGGYAHSELTTTHGWTITGDVLDCAGVCGGGGMAGLWIGCYGDGEWTTAANWDNGIVPTASDDVVINIDETVSVSGAAFAKSIILTSGGDLTVDPGNTLTVSNSNLDGISVGDGCQFINDGTVNVQNATGIGIFNEGIVTNNTGKTITISNAGDRGFRNEGTGDVLNNSGTLTITSSGAVGLNNAAGGTVNNTGGAISISDNASGAGLSNTGSLTNSGDITVANAFTYGLNMAATGTLTNNNPGTITINGSGDDGIRNQNTITNNVNATITVNNAGDYGFRNELSGDILHNHGTLIIDNSTNHSIDNFGTVTNYSGGAISITNSVTRGFNNRNVVNNNSGGTITVTSSADPAYRNGNGDVLTNEGTLTIIGSTTTDLRNVGGTVNNTSGRIEIDGSISGITSLTGTLAPGNSPGITTTDGNFDISGATLDIEVNGKTTAGTDFDQLQITGDANVGGTLVVTFGGGYIPIYGDRIIIVTYTGTLTGDFTANPILPTDWAIDDAISGEIALVYSDPCGGGGMAGLWVGCDGDNEWTTAANWDNGIVPTASDDVVINNGDAVNLNSPSAQTVKSVTLDASSTLTIGASGDLTLSGSSFVGIEVRAGTSLTNNGTIEVSTTVSSGIWNLGTVTNSSTGTITIIDGGFYGFSNSTDDIFNNSGTVSITNSIDDGIGNFGTITNSSTGTITITDAGDHGFQNAVTASILTNSGIITITDATDHGLRNLGTINNESGGAINIDGPSTGNTGTFGISISTGDNLNNSGDITVTNAYDDGIVNFGTVTNTSTGTITITNPGDYGIYNDTDDLLDNSGTIIITDSPDDGIINWGTSTNASTGTITITNAGDYGFHNAQAASILTNSGTFTISGSTNNAIQNVGGTVTNNDLLKLSGNINGVTTLAGTLAPGTSPGIASTSGSLTLTGTLDIEIDGATTAGTDYDQLQVTGTATITGATLSTTFDGGYTAVDNDRIVIVSATAIVGTFIISPGLPANWAVDYSVTGEMAIVYTEPCGGGGMAGIWVGCVGDNEWTTAANWDNGLVPTASDDVIINVDETVTIAGAAFAKSIDLSNGGDLTVNSGNTLTVSNSTADGISIGDGCNFINDGTVNVQNASSIGIFNEGTVTNNPGKTITISNSGNIGYRNNATGDQLDNYGILNINNSIAHGLTNFGTAHNHPGADLTISTTGALANGINNARTFINDADINITGASNRGINSFDSFTNNSGGDIIITSSGTAGFRQANSGDSFTNAGILTISGSIGVDFENNSGMVDNTGGTLKINGDVSGLTVLNAGTLAPGNSPGITDVTTDFNISGATLDIEIDGATTAGTDYDQLQVTGTANITGGILTVTNGYTPNIGDEMTIITATTGITGTFSTPSPVNDWYINYMANEVTLSFGGPLLPVELISFTAHEEKEEIILNWKTASEATNEGFEIERSPDGITWKILGFVEGNGTTSVIQSYNYTDRLPMSGYNYYRLKQIDFDGKYEYSEIRTVQFESSQNQISQVFPNPNNGQFTVSLYNPNGERALVKLFDSIGNLIWEKSFDDGETQVNWENEFDLPQVGVYFLSTQVGQHMETHKIMIMDKRN